MFSYILWSFDPTLFFLPPPQKNAQFVDEKN